MVLLLDVHATSMERSYRWKLWCFRGDAWGPMEYPCETRGILKFHLDSRRVSMGSMGFPSPMGLTWDCYDTLGALLWQLRVAIHRSSMVLLWVHATSMQRSSPWKPWCFRRDPWDPMRYPCETRGTLKSPWTPVVFPWGPWDSHGPWDLREIPTGLQGRFCGILEFPQEFHGASVGCLCDFHATELPFKKKISGVSVGIHGI